MESKFSCNKRGFVSIAFFLVISLTMAQAPRYVYERIFKGRGYNQVRRPSATVSQGKVFCLGEEQPEPKGSNYLPSVLTIDSMGRQVNYTVMGDKYEPISIYQVLYDTLNKHTFAIGSQSFNGCEAIQYGFIYKIDDLGRKVDSTLVCGKNIPSLALAHGLINNKGELLITAGDFAGYYNNVTYKHFDSIDVIVTRFDKELNRYHDIVLMPKVYEGEMANKVPNKIWDNDFRLWGFWQAKDNSYYVLLDSSYDKSLNLRKYDQNWKLQWNRKLSIGNNATQFLPGVSYLRWFEGNTNFNRAIVHENGDFSLLGGVVSDYDLVKQTPEDYIGDRGTIFRFNSEGVLKFWRLLPYDLTYNFYYILWDLAPTRDNGYVAICSHATYDSTTCDNGAYSKPKSRTGICKIDSNGVLQWDTTCFLMQNQVNDHYECVGECSNGDYFLMCNYYDKNQTTNIDVDIEYILFTNRKLPNPEDESVFTDMDMKIYPNPATDEITIQTRDPIAEGSWLRVQNMLGQTIVQMQCPAQVTQLSLNVNELSKGIYVISILHPIEKMRTKKLIKQ